MKLFIGLIFCSLVMGVSSDGWFSFFKEAVQGASDLWRAYWDMKEANYQNSGRYFRARGNYEAAQRGPGASGQQKSSAMSGNTFKDSYSTLEAALRGRRTRCPTGERRNGAGVDKTQITSDLLACLRNTEPPAPSAPWD
uniref:Serum amyloid A protein n=1 Tax=Sus scrofa TaxID=9823 RepID=A0A5G2QM81_PIG